MDIWTAVERLGFPIVVAGLLLAFIWKIFKWLGATVIEPIAKSHIELIKAAKSINETNARTLESIGGVIQTKSGMLDRIAGQNDQILELAQMNHDLLRGLKKTEA